MDNQQILLIVLGAGVALISSIITTIVQNSIEQRNKKKDELHVKQKTAYEAKIGANIEKSLSADDSFRSQALKKLILVDEELSNRNLDSVPTENLMELYLTYLRYILDYQDWIKEEIHTEAERINALGVDFYRELRFPKQ